MKSVFNWINSQINYVQTYYGLVGLIMLGVCIVIGVVLIYIWFDRRK